MRCGPLGTWIAWCDGVDGGRTLAVSDDADVLRVATEEELCGRAIRVASGRFELAD